MTTSFAQQMEQARDLRAQVQGLEQGDEQQFSMQESSPGRILITLWSMEDGMEITIPKYMVYSALTKRSNRSPTGYLFTGDKNKAPVFKPGNIKCFLAKGSPERESGLLENAGLDHLPYCPYEGGRSDFAKRRHGQGVHPQSWEILNEYLSKVERDEVRDEQREQTRAIRDLAGQRSPIAVKTPARPQAEVEPCPECGFVAKNAFGRQAHMRKHGQTGTGNL